MELRSHWWLQDQGGQSLTSGELLSASRTPPRGGEASKSGESFSSSSSWMGDDGDRRVLGKRVGRVEGSG